MCGSMVDIQSPNAEIRRGKKEKRKIEETTGQNIMSASATQGGHNYQMLSTYSYSNQKTSRQNACAHDRRSDGHWWYQSATDKWSTIINTPCITDSRLARPINRNMMLLQVTTFPVHHIGAYVRSQTSSSSFSRTVLRCTGRLKVSYP